MLKKYFEKNKKVAKFGVSYLDDKLRGILQGDLILIGSRSGAGKSTIANQIALYNKNNDVKVALFSLENFEGDAFIEKAYYKYMDLTKDYFLNLRDFASGDFKINQEILLQAENHAKECFKNISMHNRKTHYGIEELKNDIITEVEEKNVKLIIIDHLDYLDKYGKESDNEHMAELMKTIRYVQDAFKVAVVAISHLRKNYGSKDLPIIPSMDEFIGSGSKVKESTGVVMLAPDDDGNIDIQDQSKRSTWCCIRKLRMGGIDNKAAKIFFDTKTGTYGDKYLLYKVNYTGTKTELISDYVPVQKRVF